MNNNFMKFNFNNSSNNDSYNDNDYSSYNGNDSSSGGGNNKLFLYIIIGLIVVILYLLLQLLTKNRTIADLQNTTEPTTVTCEECNCDKITSDYTTPISIPTTRDQQQITISTNPNATTTTASTSVPTSGGGANVTSPTTAVKPTEPTSTGTDPNFIADLYEGSFLLNGKKVTLPLRYSEFAAKTGFALDAAKLDDLVVSGRMKEYTTTSGSDKIIIKVYNDNDKQDETKARDCKVIGITIFTSQYKSDNFSLYGGVDLDYAYDLLKQSLNSYTGKTVTDTVNYQGTGIISYQKDVNNIVTFNYSKNKLVQITIYANN